MSANRSQSALLEIRRNKLAADFYNANPTVSPADKSYALYLQRAVGTMPTLLQNADGSTRTVTICSCDPSGGPLLRSKQRTTDGGLTIGNEPDKDMDNEDYTNDFDPNDYYPTFFPDMAAFTDENIVQGDKAEEDRLTASYWNDLGNDVFDDWGYFYLYDVASGKYYFPLINPQNQDDGIFTTQTFTAFGRTFTITHGWSVQGIFKFDISVNDTLPFRFGAYGNMGSDGDEFTENLTYAYTVGSTPLTMYYHHHQEIGDSNEQLYSYWIPKTVSENTTQTYTATYDSDDMSMVSKEVTSGLLVYFAKSNDVKEWVASDIEFAA